MNIAELMAELQRDPTKITLLFGLTAEEYQRLNAAFRTTKDATSKVPENQKFLAILLLRKFQLDTSAIRQLIYQGDAKSVPAATITTFITKVGARLDKAFTLCPDLAAKFSAAPVTIVASINRPTDMSSLDKLLQSLQIAGHETAVVTHKARVISEAWVDAYLAKRVVVKKKTGQRAMEQVMDCLHYDIENGAPVDEYLAWQMATALSFHAHNSSYAPQTGFGLVQRREFERPLYYARSQSKHTHGELFKALTATKKSDQCLMPKNEALYRVLRVEYNKNFIRTLDHYNNLGYKKPDTPAAVAKGLKYFALQFGYVGLRKNPYEITLTGLRFAMATGTPSAVINKISDHIHYPSAAASPILKVHRAILQRRTRQYHALAADIQELTAELAYYPNLYLKLTRYRRANATQIKNYAATANLNFIKVDYDRNTNTLDIRFYPNKTIPEDANFTLGITNILINYFIGLLNAKLQAAGLEVQAERRQSFAFNRITVTDTVSMTMRVSLGYEPAAFVTVFNECLQSFNETLRECDFTNRHNPALARGFEVVERPRKEGKVTTKTGIRFFNVMRSNEGQLKATVVAKTAVRNQENRLAALQSYLATVTADNYKNAQYENPAVPVVRAIDTASPHDNLLVEGLLNNVMKYTFDFLPQARRIAETTSMPYSYAHHLGSLVKLGFKGLGWLASHNAYSSSHVYAKTLLLIESMLEHLTSLQTLLLQHDKPALNDKTYVRNLEQFEADYVKRSLAIGAAAVDVFFTDNGQQALTTSLVSMIMQVQAQPKLYAFSKCYYEFFNNLKENLEIPVQPTPRSADIICVDIREIEKLTQDIAHLNQAKAVIIDCTHNPCLSDNQVEPAVQALLEKNCFVVLVSSMLKHEQLGMDKFQNGKIAVLTPRGKNLARNVRDELQSISNQSMHPVAAAYFTMINTICQDKMVHAAPARAVEREAAEHAPFVPRL